MLKLVKKGDPSWFKRAADTLLPGVKVPAIHLSTSLDHYGMQVIKGIPLCTNTHTAALGTLLGQLTEWEENHPVESWPWHQYLDALEHRCHLLRVMKWLREQDVPCGHFCHGDLTLENVLIDRNYHLWLIDPNTRLGFNSVHVDRGKLMFSMSYHERFGSYWLTREMHERLMQIHWSVADRACLLTHIIRLNGHRNQWHIDAWLREEFERCVS